MSQVLRGMILDSVRVLLALLMAATLSPAQSPDTVYFDLDLRSPIREGWLDPTAEIVGLRGDQPPLLWGTTYPAADLDGDGLYQVEIPFVVKGDSLTVAYKIKVDGVNDPNDGWQEGRNHVVTVRRGRPLLVMLAWNDRAAPVRSTITGRVEVLSDFTHGDLAPRDVYVYVPPEYENSDSRYPVLYLHDGQNVFDSAAIGREWQMDEAAETLIQAGEIEPVIIVGIANTADRIDEYTPTRQIWRHRLSRTKPPHVSGPLSDFTGSFASGSGDTVHVTARADTLFVQIPGSEAWDRAMSLADTAFFLPRVDITLTFECTRGQPVQNVTASKPAMGGAGDRYGEFLVNGLKPYIEEHFRTRPGPEWTGLGGSSLGGLITLYLGLQHPDVFGQLLVVSPSVWWDDEWILGFVEGLPGPTDQRIWLDMGTAEGDEALTGVRTLYGLLREHGWSSKQLRYMEVPDAGHSERAWATRVPDMLRFLFPAETSQAEEP